MSTPLRRASALLRKRADLLEALLANEAEPASCTSPTDLGTIVRPLLLNNEEERLCVVALGRRHDVISAEVVSVGSVGCTIVDPAKILRWVLTRERPAAAFAIAHNHPSGDPTPSEQDHAVTRRVSLAAQAVGVTMVDHLIVAGLRSWSFAEHGHINNTYQPLPIAAEE